VAVAVVVVEHAWRTDLDVLILSVGIRINVPLLLPSVRSQGLLEPLQSHSSRNLLMDTRLSPQIRTPLLVLGRLWRPSSRLGRRSEDRIRTRQLVASLGDKLASTADGRKRVCPRDGRGDDRGRVRSGGRGLSALRLFDPDPKGVGLAVPLSGDAEVAQG
jgi:hypothetical protein